MSVIVLVHGGGHGAWCWEPLMSRLDIPSIAIDLPGRGRSPLPLDQVTPEIWADSVVATIERNDLRDVVLVGHSMGGLTILRVAARIPERLRRCVFVASPIPAAGQSLAGLMGEAFADADPDGLEQGMSTDLARDLFAHDLTERDADWLLARLVPDSQAVFASIVDLTAVGGTVPRSYIRTAFDRACVPALQDRAIATLAPIDVIEVETGHSVMVSAPDRLAAILHRLAQ